jgi:hypothetical protein
VDVLGHDDVSDNHEPVTLAGLFENVEEAVTAARGAEKRQSPIARTGDKVQMMRAVSAMQSARHENHGTDSISTRPCKERKDGAPTFQVGKESNDKQKGRATRHSRDYIGNSRNAINQINSIVEDDGSGKIKVTVGPVSCN